MAEKKKKRRRSLEFKQNSNVINLDQARNARKEKRAALKEAREEKARAREATKRQRAKLRRKLLVYVAFFLLALLVVGLSAWNLISVNVQYRDTLAENEGLQQEKTQLEEELSKTDEADYIEQQARSQLKMIKPGERLYVFPKTEPVPEADPAGSDAEPDASGAEAKGSGNPLTNSLEAKDAE